MCPHSHVNEADVGLTWQHAFDPQDISVKTKEILTNLVALADECEDSKITLEGLKRHHFPPVTENFLFHLAAAEQLLRIWCCFQCLCSERLAGWTLAELWLSSYAVDVGIIVASWKAPALFMPIIHRMPALLKMAEHFLANLCVYAGSAPFWPRHSPPFYFFEMVHNTAVQ